MLNHWFQSQFALGRGAAAALALSAGVAANAQADTLQPLESIDRQIVAFTGADIGRPGGASQPVDRRMRLRACTAALVLGWYGSSRQAVAVSCPDNGGWRIYVPVVAADSGGQSQASAGADQTVVKRRDRVRVEARGNGFTVVRQGEALENGAAGDWIRVQMVVPAGPGARSPTIITAQVQEVGRVSVALR